MDKRLFELHAEVCKAFANAKRLEIIYALRDGEHSVEELVEILDLPKANISQHLTILRQRQAVIARREGLYIYYRLSNPKIAQACDLMREVLKEHLEENRKIIKGREK